MICENDFDHDLIIQKYNELKEKHPEFDERTLLEKVFSKLSKDFVEDSNAFPKTYYCRICKSNHYFSSEIGKKHLAQNQKTLTSHKLSNEEIEKRFKINQKKFQERIKSEQKKEDKKETKVDIKYEEFKKAIERANLQDRYRVKKKSNSIQYQEWYQSATGGYWGRTSFDRIILGMKNEDLFKLTAKYSRGRMKELAKKKLEELQNKKSLIQKEKTKTSNQTKLGVNKNLYKEIQNETKKTNDECGYVITEDGRTFKIKGKGKEINQFDVIKITKKLTGKLTFIHSHPGEDSPFSSSDMEAFILSSKLRKAGIITKNGTVYEFKKPNNIEKYSNDDISKAKNRFRNSIARMRNRELDKKEVFDYAVKYFSDKYHYNLKYNREKLKEDFLFPESMSKSVGEKKIIKKCKDCKKEKEVYYKGKDFYLCEECYKKREKHYIEVYDSKEEQSFDMILLNIAQEFEYTKDFVEDLKSKYYCRKCNSYHFYDSDVGKEHLKITSKEIKKKDRVINEKKVFSDLINEKTMKKYKRIKEYNERYQEEGLEYGFAISQFGTLTGRQDESILIGKRGSIDVAHQAYKEFGSGINLKYVIHSHPEIVDKGIKTFANKFSLEDLIGVTTHKDIPGLVYHEYSREIINGKAKEYDTYYLKVGLNIPKDRSKLIEEYGSVFREYKKKEQEWNQKWNPKHDPYYFLEQSNKDYEMANNEHERLVEKYVSKIEELEEKYNIKTKKLFRHIYKHLKKKDFIESLTTDEAKSIRYIPSNIPSGQTRLQKLWEQQKAFERAKRLGKEIGVEPLVGGVQSITLPFSITNTETGTTIKGEVVENLEENTKQLTPLSSSNARASGQFKNELLVQFHPSKLTPMRTYRYMFETSEQAKEANEALQKSGSPGRWIWQNLRGHIAGEKVTASKVAPSLVPPNQGLPTIGGTSASLVPYKISNRVPVSRVKNFNEILKEMKRSNPNPTTNPLTGSRLESLLGTRKELRELGNKNFRRGTYGLPPVGDFEYVGNLNELEEDYNVHGYYANRGKPQKRTWIRKHTRGEGESIKEKPRLTDKYVQWKHEQSKNIPLWRKMKKARKMEENLTRRIINMLSESISNIPINQLTERDKRLFELQERREYYRQQLQIPNKSYIKSEIDTYKHSLEWAKQRKQDDKKEIEFEEKYKEAHGSYANYTIEEFNKFLKEPYERWDARIENHKRQLELEYQKLKEVEEFESQLFEDKSKIKNEFDITLHDKIKIAKGLSGRYPINELINEINNTYYELPNSLKETIKEVRIFEKANDDPTFGSLQGCGGFYHPTNKAITLGCTSKRKNFRTYSKNFVREAVYHEAAHSLDFQRLNQTEQGELFSFFTVNYPRLKKRGEYASTDKMEFFAEGYAKLSMGNDQWFLGLRKGTKQFFKDIMQKYDFIKINNIMLNEDINEKNNGIKFSYSNEDGIHVFGFYQIPEDISLIEAEMMVEEGKAQFENIDKYINKEVKNDKKGNKENMP